MLFDRSGPGADFEELHLFQDRASGLRAILAIHSTRLGPAFGGIRRHAYGSQDEAVDDALRLAEAMTAKCALAGIPAGGGKMVVLDHPGLDRAAVYGAVGRHVDHMEGRYVCGPDVGTTEADLDAVRAETEWVNPRGNDPGSATAAGVIAGIRGVTRVLDGDDDVGGHTFVIQGLGSVGRSVAATLLEAGATVLGCDVDEEAVREAKALGVVVVPANAALSTPCDVLVPCALGRILSTGTVRQLRARAVCGSANNQLESPDVARLLQEAGILYAPDLVVNCGAVVEGFYTIRDGARASVRRKAARHIETVEETVVTILERAAAEGRTSDEVARDMVRERLDAAA